MWGHGTPANVSVPHLRNYYNFIPFSSDEQLRDSLFRFFQMKPDF